MFIQTTDESGKDIYAGIDKLLLTLEKTGKHYDIEKIKKAYLYAKELHAGQYRCSGEEYISHPVAVAEIVAGLELDTDSICAALLHDTVEDCVGKTDLPTIRKEFGDDVASLVDGLTKMVQIPFEDKEEQHIENLRKMFLAMSKDVRVIFIKLSDRLHNMRTLGVKKDAKRRMTALETMQVFAPLAHRLGMQRMKQELENLSLEYLDPIGYEEIRKDIEKRYGESRDFIEKARAQVADKLTEAGINFILEGRVKSVYSIYRKMYQQNKSFDEIFDFYALRVIVNTEEECYVVLGLIHEMFSMIPGLENAEFVRYGVMHRNTFLDAPRVLSAQLCLKAHPNVFFAGQITGFEGYMESAASGLLAARNLYARLQGRELPPPPTTTMCGALIDYITTPNKDFQPMGANMGILPRTEEIDTIRDKRERYMALSDAAQAAMRAWAAEAEH